MAVGVADAWQLADGLRSLLKALSKGGLRLLSANFPQAFAVGFS